MDDKATIVDLLNEFSKQHQDIAWKLECTYADGRGTTMNQITILSHEDQRKIGVFGYRVETGVVLFCTYKQLKKTDSENIIDLLLDVINYSKGKLVA